VHTRMNDDHALLALFQEDVPFGDLTTDGLGLAGHQGSAEPRARSGMIACGVEHALRLFQLAGAQGELACRSGDAVSAGQLLLRAQGDAADLHRAWKTAQTLGEAMSGIATATHAIVEAVRTACPGLHGNAWAGRTIVRPLAGAARLESPVRPPAEAVPVGCTGSPPGGGAVAVQPAGPALHDNGVRG
jgi:Quinolinate phosphoribosyl transferase, N-terminal domain